MTFKIFAVLLFLASEVLIFSPTLFAQVVINEFQLSPSTDQWIELYNKNPESTDISGWVIDDDGASGESFAVPSGTLLLPGKCISFKSSLFNWNTAKADQVRLITPEYSEIYSYTKSPGENISVGRENDGEGELIVLGHQSRDLYNATGLSCLTPVESTTPTPTNSPSPSPSPYRAVYKINTPKDSNGSNMGSVGIYVDGTYIHHEDEETLYFYNGHECYTGVDCGLGIHTISLRKSGYSSWEDTQDFVAGNDLSVSPVLHILATQTSSPTKSPTSTTTPLPTEENNATFLATSTADAQTYNILGTSDENEYQNSEQDKVPVWPFIIVFAGISFIGVSLFSIIRSAKKKDSEIP